jgi:hypothetical protein
LDLQFFDFSTILYGFYNVQPKHIREWWFFSRVGPWKIWRFTDMPFVCAKAPGITWILQFGPRGLWAARPVNFQQGACRRGLGKGRSGPRESHATDLWLELGSGRRRQGGATARRFPRCYGWMCR